MAELFVVAKAGQSHSSGSLLCRSLQSRRRVRKGVHLSGRQHWTPLSVTHFSGNVLLKWQTHWAAFRVAISLIRASPGRVASLTLSIIHCMLNRVLIVGIKSRHRQSPMLPTVQFRLFTR